MVQRLKISSHGQGIPVVFLHGWGVNAGIWQQVADDFDQGFEVITIDLPGFAQNKEAVRYPYTLEDVASRIVEAVGKPAVYVGWSLGGLVASEIALSYPKQVLALATVASSPYFVANDNWPGIAPQVLETFHQQLSHDTRKTIDGFLKIQAMGSPHIRQEIKLIRELVMQYPMADKQTLDCSLDLLQTTDHRHQLAKISQPFLRIYGKLDGLVPKAVIEQIAQLAPQSEQFIFERSSHAPFICHRIEFIELLTGWLTRNISTT